MRVDFILNFLTAPRLISVSRRTVSCRHPRAHFLVFHVKLFYLELPFLVSF